jgi:1-aminocyclopropane-1-carboxylate deaminase
MHTFFQNSPTVPMQEVLLPLLKHFGLSLFMKRLDLIHPQLSGNKFFKLKYNLQQAQLLGYKKVLTFGGAYSNHIYATSAAARLTGMEAVGIIRGEEHGSLNPTLSFASSQGMKLVYWDRELYRNKNKEEVMEKLKGDFGDFYLIPEGGTNEYAIQGTSEILENIDQAFDVICTPIGTGGTFAGIVHSALPHQKVMGYSALKGDFIFEEIDSLMKANGVKTNGTYEIRNSYHFGGYGKFTQELIDFILDFYQQTSIPLDPIYTGKMMFGILRDIEQGLLAPGQKILALHTGGLQGNKGFNALHNTHLPFLE